MNVLSQRTFLAGIIIAGGLLTGIAVIAMIRMLDEKTIGGNALIFVFSLIGLIAIIWGSYHFVNPS
jgi:hypothetical protein